MKRIILHWTAGNYKASGLDKQHYHYIVEGDGTVVQGKFKPEANLAFRSGGYAAHTLNCNTDSIGVAVAAMAGAVQSPFKFGLSPITDAQIKSLVRLVAQLCRTYSIPVKSDTVLTHAEVQPTLGIQQRGKWDITWLPGFSKSEAPIFVGDILRDKIRRELSPRVVEAPAAPPIKPARLADEPVKGNLYMNPTYLRVVLYFLAPLIGSIPGVTYAADAGQLIIDIEKALAGIGASALVSGAVFAKWGKK